MSQTLQEILVEAIDDEYKARATYNQVIEEFGEIRPFVNIVNAEGRHIQALLPLFDRYGIDVPDDTWNERVEVPRSIQEACQNGVQAEIDNAEMYDRLLAATTAYPDVQQVLRNLQRASQENHLPAFQRAANGSAAFGAAQPRHHSMGEYETNAIHGDGAGNLGGADEGLRSGGGCGHGGAGPGPHGGGGMGGHGRGGGWGGGRS